jgi:hypothetical protein
MVDYLLDQNFWGAYMPYGDIGEGRNTCES